MNSELQQTLANYSQFLKTSERQNSTSTKLIDIMDNILDCKQNEGDVQEQHVQLKNILKPYEQDKYIKNIISLIDKAE